MRRHVIIYSLLSLALIAAVLVAVDYGTRAQAASDALEDAYTQRLLEAQERLQALSLKLAKAPLTGEGAPLVELLAGVSRQSDGVATELSALPLSHVAMSDTVKFCNQLAEYSLSLAIQSAAGDALAQEDITQLAALQRQCSLLLGQFATAQSQMLSQSLRLAASSDIYYDEAQLAQRPLEQVSDADNGMDYPTMIYDGAFSDARHNGAAKALGAETISAAQAVEIAVRFVGAERVREATQGVATEGALAAYGVTLTLNDGTVLNAEITKRGGKPLWMMPEHASFTPSLTLEECRERAAAFLAERGYGEMEANHYQVYDGLAVLNFVCVESGVLLYPDLVKVQLRMDTGEVVGLEANNYLMNHARRGTLTAKLTRDEALARVSDRLSAEDARLCVIPYRDTERLCWEISGTYESERYLIYLDASEGEQVELFKLIQTSDGMLSA